LDGRKGRAFRRRFGIIAYVGPNGSGKTLAAVGDCLPSLEAGRPVLSTVRLTTPAGDDHPMWVPFRTWKDLLSAEHCDVLMDEVTGVASSREAMGLPGPVANLLVQLRRRDVVLRWTAPSWSRADRIIRECTQVAALCSGHMAREADGSQWRTNRLFSVRCLDARELDDLTAGVVKRSKAMNRSWSRIGAMAARDAYDTLDQVLALPVVEGGRCAVCGGRRSVPKCECG
jgi:hypothetical protein